MEMVLGFFKSILELYSAQLPSSVIGILLLIASFRVIFKPLFAFAYAITAITPSPKDDAAVKKIEDGKIVKAIKFALDWIASIKFPAKK
jgi:hypothetical protein